MSEELKVPVEEKLVEAEAKTTTESATKDEVTYDGKTVSFEEYSKL